MLMKQMKVVVMLLVLASSAWAVTIKDEQRIKDPNGKTIAVLVTCEKCERGECMRGVDSGSWEGQPCGECFIKSNYGYRIGYGYDLSLNGRLQDAKGQPIGSQFVKLSMPNGWTVTTRTTSDGAFRMTLGATLERVSKTPIEMNVGTFTFKKGKGREDAFNFYMLPEQFKPCPESKGKK
jgi:hypothetical protein